jgi:hypothetical protein
MRVQLNGVHGDLIHLDVYYLVRPSFTDLDGDPVSADSIERLTLKSRTGARMTFHGDEAKWLHGARVVPYGGREWLTKRIDWQAESAFVRGSNVVNRGQQRFVPAKDRNPSIELLFYSATFTVRDALFGSPTGKAVVLHYPDGTEETRELDDDGNLELPALPRGDYEVSVDALGYSAIRPLALSRDQNVDLQVISYLDMALVLAVLLGIALALLLARRPELRSTIATRVLSPRTAWRALRG